MLSRPGRKRRPSSRNDGGVSPPDCDGRVDYPALSGRGSRPSRRTSSAAATLGIVLPSFGIIFLISRFLDSFLEITWIAHAFMGIKLAVGILILDAGIRMLRKMQKKALPRAIMLCAFAAMLLVDLFALRVSSIMLMLIAALVSFAIFLAKRNARAERGET